MKGGRGLEPAVLPQLQTVGQAQAGEIHQLQPREVRQRDEARAVSQVKRLQRLALAQPLRQRDEALAVAQVKRLQRLALDQPLR